MPCLQGDIFVQHSQKLELLKTVLRNVAELDALEGLNMIDAVQRLGIDYNFQREIDEILHKQMSIVSARDDLHEVALRFRLLRQHGYFVPEGKFNHTYYFSFTKRYETISFINSCKTCVVIHISTCLLQMCLTTSRTAKERSSKFWVKTSRD